MNSKEEKIALGKKHRLDILHQLETKSVNQLARELSISVQRIHQIKQREKMGYYPVNKTYAKQQASKYRHAKRT